MYSVEFEHEDSIITILDETGTHEDLIITLKDNYIIIEQAELVEEFDISNTIIITYEMLQDLLAACKSPEGFYKVIRNKK